MKIIIMPLVLFAVAVLSGCGQGVAIRNAGAVAEDQLIDTAEWSICNAASVGSVRRKYGSDEEKAAAWRVICRSGDAQIIGEKNNNCSSCHVSQGGFVNVNLGVDYWRLGFG